ncbi:MAG: tetratricopeptide repeat protein [Bacteroidetes bacterium]|nr:tetratricopeptide repeat protein [Bacteroidota bacterium]
MIRPSKIKSLFFLCALFISVSSFSQRTYSYQPPQSDYDKALELYNNGKYGSALSMFDNLASGEKSNLQAGSSYYAALCAVQLFHPDATQRLEQFIATYPQNAQVNNAYFELGKQYFQNKDYRKVLDTFKELDIYDLSNDQLMEYFFKTGYSWFKLDNLAKARENLALVKDKPNKFNIPANYYYAHIAYQEKNYETALQHFEKVQNDETFRDVVNYYIVQIYSMQMKYDELLVKALPLLKGDDDRKTTEIARLTADAYYHKGDYKEALKYFKRYIAGNPKSISRNDYYEMAFCYYLANDYNQAIKNFQQVATNQDSLSQNAYFNLGNCYLKTNQKRYAFNAFSSASKIKLDPVIAEEALFNYAKLAIELSYNPYNEAVNAVQDYLNTYPNSLRKDEAYGYLADLYMLTRNYKNAQASIQQIKKRNARLDAAFQKISYYRGIEVFNEGNWEDAIKLFKEVQTSGADNSIKAAAIYWTAEAYYRSAQWNSALAAYNKFLVSPGAIGQPFFNTANYNIGYCYFKTKDYGKAALNFRKFLSAKSADVRLTGDANLRLGDCYFMTKEYGQAIEFYKTASSSGIPDADYSVYQIAVSYGVQGDMQQKINYLQKLLNEYKKSSYTDDALYEIGTTLTVINKDAEAIKYFQRVVKEYPKSAYVKKSLLRTGLVYFGQNKDAEALSTLQRVVKEYPGTPESKEALASIKSIYVDMNQVDEYMEFTKQVPNADVSRSEQDSLTYTAAENQYMNGDCEKANAGFGKYITKFPEGSFLVQAYFYKAECDYRTEKYDLALKGYEYVLSQERSRFTCNAALKAARINYFNKNYEPALENFIRLEETAEQSSQTIDAITGQMQCNYNLGKYGLAIQSAQKLLTQAKLPDNLATEAHITIARSAYALQNMELAKKEFEETLKLSQNEMGAESKFMLAQLQFDEGKFDEAEKTVFALSDKFASYDYWVAKGFILLADVYVKKDNAFQAKQTLQSIIDNYEGQDLVVIAREKLNAILATEVKPQENSPE